MYNAVKKINNPNKTRITTFIKTKFKISEDQTNIDKYIYISCKYYSISYYIKINLATNHYHKLLWSSESFEVKYNIGFGIPIKFPSQRKKIIQIGPETTKLDFCGPNSHLGKVQYRILNPHQISKPKKKKKYSNRSSNNEIML